MPVEQPIALMYSGGLDTTYAALQLGREFGKIHLLTFCNGFCVRVNSSRRHASLFAEKFGPQRYEHSVVFVADIFSYLRRGLFKEMRRYRSPLLFDLCCRLSMEVATVCYCLEHGIRFATDGSNPDTQGEMFIQQEEYLKVVGDFFARYGITYVRPYLRLKNRKEIARELERSGIRTGVRGLENLGITSQLLTQPFCLWAPLAFFFTSYFRHLPFVRPFALRVQDAVQFRLEKEKAAGAMIDYFKLHSTLAGLYPCRRQGPGFFRIRKWRC